MKKVLCFGDSNVYGFIPENGKRYPKDTRWSGALANMLGNNYEVVEAGCNNRTAFSDNPNGSIMCGVKVLPKLLGEHFDIVILAVGINDLQFAYNVKLSEFQEGLERLISIVRKILPNAQIVLISPSKIGECILNSCFAELFDKTSIKKSHSLGEIYRKTAFLNRCKCLDLDEIVKPSEFDGLHYSKIAHSKIALAISKLIISET